MAVAPTGIASLPLKYLRDSLAECASFQTWTGAANAAAALAFVHYVGTTTLTLPVAFVSWGGDARWRMNAGGVRNHTEQEGDLELVLRGAVSTSTDAGEPDESMTLMNLAGAVIAELLLLAGTGGFLDIVGISHGEPMRPRKAATTASDFVQVTLSVRYRSFA